MRKVLSLFMVMMLLVSLTACGNKAETDKVTTDSATTETKDTTSVATETTEPAETDQTTTENKEPVTIEIFQGKVEFIDQLDAFIKKFEAKYPYITVNADTVGGGQDYAGSFRSRMTSGNEPDIFNATGPTDMALWQDYLEPLNDQPWVANCYDGTLDMMTATNGNIYGLPYNVEGYGLIYNKDMFEKAGVDASKIVTLTALKDAFAKLDAAKSTLGIEKVLSFSIGDSAWWTAAIHNFNIPFAMQVDPTGFIQALNEGKETLVGNDRMLAYLDMLDTFFKYSYDDLLTVSYDDQVNNFALGKTAVLHQGNWTAGMLSELGADLNIAFLPIPISDDATWGNDSIPVGVPNFWCVNSHSTPAEKEAAKLFLDYYASSEDGAQLLADSNFIAAFKNVKNQPSDDLAASILDYSAKGKTIPWTWFLFPTGMMDPAVKEAIQKYYTGEFTKDEFLKYLDEQWQAGVAKMKQ